MNQNLLSSLNKINNAQLTKDERDAVIQELRSNHYKISDVAKAMKLSKGRISQIEHGYTCATTPFIFYRWLSEADEIKDLNIPLTDAQKKDVDLLILKLTKIRNMRLK